MVVADGMGGMNAGEVASDIAIKTVQNLFSPKKMPADVVKSPDSIKKYIKKVITEADHQVKKQCKKDPSTQGMGSTIVLAWLLGGRVYVGWMGDSRAYSYIPEKGISRLSKDHSYVQELVDAKMITEEEAMIHPQSNVIMRSLGDVAQKAKPDIICHPVSNGEIILLCSDGLCGVCTDESIAEIIKQTSDDLRNCKESLTNAALEADGSDNITIALMQIVDTSLQITGENWTPDSMYRKRMWLTWKDILLIVLAIALLFSLGVSWFKSCGSPQPQDSLPESIVNKDTVFKNIVKEDSIVDKESKKESTKVNKKISEKRTQTFMEKTTKGPERDTNTSIVSEDPEKELTESNTEDPLKVDTTKLKP